MSSSHKSDCPFCFEAVWSCHPFFGVVVKEAWKGFDQDLYGGLRSAKVNVLKFNKNIFNNIFKRKRILNARLDGIQRALDRKHSHSLVKLEKQLRVELK